MQFYSSHIYLSLTQVKEFSATLEQDGLKAGVKLVKGGEPLPTNDRIENLTKCFEKMQKGGAKIVLVVMLMDISYGIIKLVSNKMGTMPSWEPPRNGM
jgi:hypothetical protein